MGRNQQLHFPPFSPYLSGIEGGGRGGGGGGGTFSIMINLAEIGHHIFRCGQHYRNQEMLVWWGDIGGFRYTKKVEFMYRTQGADHLPPSSTCNEDR